jgi:hypothetical protein
MAEDQDAPICRCRSCLARRAGASRTFRREALEFITHGSDDEPADDRDPSDRDPDDR